jgi:hypothetical protein
MSVCQQCGQPIYFTKALGGWTHSLNRSVWCGRDDLGQITGSCQAGPKEGWDPQ